MARKKAVKKKQKNIEDMSTVELANQCVDVLKECEEGVAQITKQVCKLARLFGVGAAVSNVLATREK